MKKLTAVIISITMFFSMCVSVSALSAASTNKTIIVNGTQYEVATYPMFGSEYGVKLRDIATMLDGTRLQFNLTWDGTTNSVYMESGAYQPVGGEMQLGDGSEKELIYSEQYFVINSNLSDVEAYMIDGNNYVSLEWLMTSFYNVPVMPNADGIMEINTDGSSQLVDEH